jgi:hypothetical protein
MVNNDGEGCWAHPDKASHLVYGVKEGSTKVMEVVEDGDLPCAVHHKEKTVGLIELHKYILSSFASKSIALVKPAMFWLLDLFTAVSKLNRAFQEAWWIMVTFYFYKMLLGGWLWL